MQHERTVGIIPGPTGTRRAPSFSASTTHFATARSMRSAFPPPFFSLQPLYRSNPNLEENFPVIKIDQNPIDVWTMSNYCIGTPTNILKVLFCHLDYVFDHMCALVCRHKDLTHTRFLVFLSRSSGGSGGGGAGPGSGSFFPSERSSARSESTNAAACRERSTTICKK